MENASEETALDPTQKDRRAFLSHELSTVRWLIHLSKDESTKSVGREREAELQRSLAALDDDVS